MSFFGFDQPDSLEDEKRKFLEGSGAQQENVAVYTWGEESYDGLGDALQERGDELNDETFGGSGAVGKDFDFSHTALPTESVPVREAVRPQKQPAQASPRHVEVPAQRTTQPIATSRTANALESIWDDRSPFSVLPKGKANGSSRAPEPATAPIPAAPPAAPSFSPFGPDDSNAIPQQPINIGANHLQGARTLEEIEAEMREAFAAQRISAVSPSNPPVLSQAQLRNTSAHRHMGQYTQGSTPPPRMHTMSQSPRFQQQHHAQLLQQQQQHLALLEMQEQQLQRQHLLELQEQQLKFEELERQRQQIRQAQINAQYLQHQRQNSAGTPVGEVGYRDRRYRSATPSRLSQQQQPQPEAPFQQNMQYLPRDIQMQQRLLAEMAQAEFLHSLQGSPVRELADDKMQEVLRAEAMRKIMEAERMEEKRRRKLEKIRYMSRYNDLMTQSDKDFITRIQVSQLVTQDPYADDFYAQVYGAIMRSRMGLNAPEALLKFSSGGGVGLGLAQVKGGGRRPSAMQRMQQQVERIVNNARLREKEKISLNSLQGALGKTAGRSYKAAPRQLLQVDPTANGASSSPTLSHASAHISKADAAHPETDALANDGAMARHILGLPGEGLNVVQKDPLTHRESLVLLERLFDIIIEAESIKREVEDGAEYSPQREAEFALVVDRLWEGLRVGNPLLTSNPHPFISLLTPIKGKRMLPRVTRFFDGDRLTELIILLVACFSQLDVVQNAYHLDTLEDTPEKREVEAQTTAFLASVMQSIMPATAVTPAGTLRGFLIALMQYNNIGAIARTKPGIALLTMFISRAETINQELTSGTADPAELPSAEEWTEWKQTFDHMFKLLAPHLVFLFPSMRIAVTSGVQHAEVPDLDHLDQPTWQFLGTLAAHSSAEQHALLVMHLRDRILESITSAKKNWTVDEEGSRLRLANVDMFLHAMALDSSQVAV